MCYFSKTLRREQYRENKVGEDLILERDRLGHAYPVAEADGKIVCVFDGSEVHIDKLILAPEHAVGFRNTFPALVHFEGKPVSARFVEMNGSGLGHGPAADILWVEDEQGRKWQMHLAYLGAGMKFYTGPKRPLPLETRLGVDDPSIVHDHKPIDEMPTLERALGVVSVCSITR